MKKLLLSLTAVAAFALIGFDSKTAEAAHGFGFHYGGPLLHIDVGNPHGYRYGSAYHARRTCAARPQYSWHNTSHFDYLPPRTVRHGNHYDRIPGRVIYHQTGHWDRHHGHH